MMTVRKPLGPGRFPHGSEPRFAEFLEGLLTGEQEEMNVISSARRGRVDERRMGTV